MKKITLYGIPNCDITKKAMQWLAKHKVPYIFHDYKQEGITRQKLEDWDRKAGWETIFNKRSTTWRELPEAEQQRVSSLSAAIKIMMANNSIIKRPVLEIDDTKILVGFKEEIYETELT